MDLYRRRKIEGHIDMTPLIDTLLQLFMFFLLSVSFASSVRLDLPRATDEQKNITEPIVVSLNSANELFLNDEPVLLSKLPEQLAFVLKQSEKRLVILRADRTLVYQRILEVLVKIQNAGADRVLLAYDVKAQR